MKQKMKKNNDQDIQYLFTDYSINSIKSDLEKITSDNEKILFLSKIIRRLELKYDAKYVTKNLDSIIKKSVFHKRHWSYYAELTLVYKWIKAEKKEIENKLKYVSEVNKTKPTISVREAIETLYIDDNEFRNIIEKFRNAAGCDDNLIGYPQKNKLIDKITEKLSSHDLSVKSASIERALREKPYYIQSSKNRIK